MPVWDPQVRYYNMHDENGVFLGGFYADWYPRENKRGGAWMDALITGGPAPDGFQPAPGTDLRQPDAAGRRQARAADAPRSGDDLPRVRPPAASHAEPRRDPLAWPAPTSPGISSSCRRRSWRTGAGSAPALDLFARHYETGEPIPEELFQKMKRARTFRAANAQMRQLGFGFIDLLLHVSYSPERDGDVVAYTRASAAGVQPRAAARRSTP